MKLKISIEYFTKPGESLTILFSDGKEIPMRYVLEGIWTAAEDVTARSGSLDYTFILLNHGNTVRREWTGHHIPLPKGKKPAELEVRDCWHDRPVDSPFWTKAFSDVIFRKKDVEGERSGNLVFIVAASQVRSGEQLAVTGSGAMFGNWKKFLPFSTENAPLWSLFLDVKEPFEYKFVILDAKTKKPRIWEDGPNHFFAEVPSKGSALVIRDIDPKFTRQPWRGAGVAVPVFSLRSESSFGVGEFADIKKLADWAALTGQSVIQLLPINDTTMSRTWTDSYPYNANSTFALHPQFINLPDAGVKLTKEFKALQKELNSLEKIDYERVNNEKTRLLKETFASIGEKDLEGGEFRAFFKANEHWLIPYSAFCVLRDQNGTPEFEKWKTNSKYSKARVAAFCKRNRREIDFYCWEQFCLDRQLKDAVDYAHSKGVAIKGDLPIGISRTSVDAWQYPELFNLDSQAGAPPDAFSEDGQNWGFPTYNWDEMAKDDYGWWKSRLGKMSEYFDAFRIDHILGFFRIWEIPLGIKSGLLGHFNPALQYSADEIRARGFDPNTDLFVPDPHRDGWYHPRIASQNTDAYHSLNDWQKNAYNELYNDFFYRRNNDFWKECAMRKLPALLDSTKMLACGEDLGMIPACVPETMQELRILSLEIQRMPKSPKKTFDEPWTYPYMSVCTTGTHDTSTLRAWWEEDSRMTERFYHEILHCKGQTPQFCEPWICERILEQHLASPSMLCILPLQDWESVDGEARYQGNPADDRINVPANPRHYWRWRMHGTLEELLNKTSLNEKIRGMIKGSARG